MATINNGNVTVLAATTPASGTTTITTDSPLIPALVFSSSAHGTRLATTRAAAQHPHHPMDLRARLCISHPSSHRGIHCQIQQSYKPTHSYEIFGHAAFGKEFGNLAQGDTVTNTPGTNSIYVLGHEAIRNIPRDRTVTYTRIVVDYRPQKSDPNRVRLTAGGNLIEYLCSIQGPPGPPS